MPRVTGANLELFNPKIKRTLQRLRREISYQPQLGPIVDERDRWVIHCPKLNSSKLCSTTSEWSLVIHQQTVYQCKQL